MSNAKVGIGGAPTRNTSLPNDPKLRKQHPVATGFLDYFPDAVAEVSRVSWNGNEQHNPGQPLHWARGKSMDTDDTMMRHFLQRGTRDTDGQRHSAKMAWRALAILQQEIETDQLAEQEVALERAANDWQTGQRVPGGGPAPYSRVYPGLGGTIGVGGQYSTPDTRGGVPFTSNRDFGDETTNKRKVAEGGIQVSPDSFAKTRKA